jgi:hypothetical protein
MAGAPGRKIGCIEKPLKSSMQTPVAGLLRDLWVGRSIGNC